MRFPAASAKLRAGKKFHREKVRKKEGFLLKLL
jgi:hypothetical protein